MSAPATNVDEGDRLARVKPDCTIEPRDLRGTGLVKELSAGRSWATSTRPPTSTNTGPSRSGKCSPISTPDESSSRQQTAAFRCLARATSNSPSSSERFAGGDHAGRDHPH